MGGGPGAVDVSSVTTEAELVELIQEAYGDAGLDLHRGHQPVQELVDALVESWSPAIDSVLATGEITDEEADRYRAALEEAFTFRITWDGEEATPTYSGLAA